jgi:mannose-6-phosphate isomerase-like protein (cupin superfamily)
MKIVRFEDAPTFAPAGHADVVNHALVSTEWHQTPELHSHEGATQVYIVQSGSFVVEDADGEHTLSARDTAIIGPGEVHRIRAEGKAEVLVITTPGLR